VATYSTGITATFASTTLNEITALSWNWGSGMPIGRTAVFQPVLGQITVETIGSASTGMYGTRDSMSITGGGVALTCTAVCTDIAVTAEVNGVARYALTFDILDN
jgi:hypothetical protein